MNIEDVKTALRVSTDAFDGEIQALVDAAEADLQLVGINMKPPDFETAESCDPLIELAVILYAKANFGFFEDSERYIKAYEHLKCALSLAGDYRAME